MHYTLSVKTQPASEPVTLAEAKAHLSIDSSNTAWDSVITDFIKAAREQAEIFTNRCLLPQTLTMILDYFPFSAGNDSQYFGRDRAPSDARSFERLVIQLGGAGPIEIPRAPLISVDSITYTDTTGATQTLATSEYVVDAQGDDEPVRILPAYGKTWPATRIYPNAVTIQFQAGYANAAAVPSSIKSAIKQIVGTWQENRESVVTDTRVAALELPEVGKALLWPYRLF